MTEASTFDVPYSYFSNKYKGELYALGGRLRNAVWTFNSSVRRHVDEFLFLSIANSMLKAQLVDYLIDISGGKKSDLNKMRVNDLRKIAVSYMKQSPENLILAQEYINQRAIDKQVANEEKLAADQKARVGLDERMAYIDQLKVDDIIWLNVGMASKWTRNRGRISPKEFKFIDIQLPALITQIGIGRWDITVQTIEPITASFVDAVDRKLTITKTYPANLTARLITDSYMRIYRGKPIVEYVIPKFDQLLIEPEVELVFDVEEWINNIKASQHLNEVLSEHGIYQPSRVAAQYLA